MKNIAIYYRVSTDKQDLASQQDALKNWLENLPEAKRPKNILEFRDEGISGKTTKRPGYQALLNAAYQGKCDTIVVYRLDRFSRNASDAIKTLLALDEAGVGFISVTQPILNLGTDNPFRRTMLAAFAEIAEIERETIAARVRSGLDAAKRRGVKLGPPVKIDTALAEKARHLRETGQSYRQIAQSLSLSVGAVHKLLSGLNEASG